jgi:hypothetical protein
MKYIGYVSMPFGSRDGTDFTKLYTGSIFPAPTVATGSSDVILFREDAARPHWETRHLERIDRFTGGHHTSEFQLRQSIQENIVGSDLLVAVLTDFNPNVMLEIGFAQAQRKHIIYVLKKSQFTAMPSNLGNLKRLHLYDTPDDLKYNLYNRIQEVIDSLRVQHGSLDDGASASLSYYPTRQSIALEEKFRTSTKRIQILTTNLTTVSANYIDAIGFAVDRNPELTVRILTSDPQNLFIDPRADQLLEDKKGYRMELQGSLESIRAKLKRYQNCEVRTYKDFPVQLWHLIDDHIYIGQSSLVRRTRHNCAFGISVDTPGVKETYLDHFDRLWKKGPETHAADSLVALAEATRTGLHAGSNAFREKTRKKRSVKT